MFILKRKVLGLLTFLVCASLVFTGCNVGSQNEDAPGSKESAAETYLIDVGTATTGGVYNAIGAGLANFFSNKVEGLSARAVVTGGTVDNINLLERGEIETCLAVAGFAYLAYNGEDQWEGRPQKNLRGVTYLFDSAFHFVARKDSGIEKLEDLRGTKGSPGARASGNENILNKYWEKWN